VTATPGLVLGVLVADCAPVLLADPTAGVAAAAHAGRRGLQHDIVGAAVDAMVALGARPERTAALIGPCICADHYEVPAEMSAEVVAVAPEAAARTPAGTAALDLRAGLAAQLRAAGVARHTIAPECTYADPALYSFRRDGTTGRFAGFVWLGSR
jgi:YfiH family protein